MTPMENAPRSTPRVSILARAVPALSYALPALGAAISSLLVMNVFRGMRNAESAGIVAVTAGISEANLAILVTLYLAIIVGFVGVVIGLVRMFTTITTASPSGWYFAITGAVGMFPMLLLWQAQSVLLNVLFGRVAGGVAETARAISLLLMLSMFLGIVSSLILLLSSVVPLPTILRAKRKWAPVVVLLLMETAIIAMTVLYHLRTAWLYGEYQKY